MKKLYLITFLIALLFAIILCLNGCTLVSTISSHCKTQTSKTENGNFIFCALCDSATGSSIIKTLKTKP